VEAVADIDSVRAMADKGCNAPNNNAVANEAVVRFEVEDVKKVWRLREQL
jgi:hypothetical protein